MSTSVNSTVVSDGAYEYTTALPFVPEALLREISPPVILNVLLAATDIPLTALLAAFVLSVMEDSITSPVTGST